MPRKKSLKTRGRPRKEPGLANVSPKERDKLLSEIANPESLSRTELTTLHGLAARIAEQCFIAGWDKENWQPPPMKRGRPPAS